MGPEFELTCDDYPKFLSSFLVHSGSAIVCSSRQEFEDLIRRCRFINPRLVYVACIEEDRSIGIGYYKYNRDDTIVERKCVEIISFYAGSKLFVDSQGKECPMYFGGHVDHGVVSLDLERRRANVRESTGRTWGRQMNRRQVSGLFTGAMKKSCKNNCFVTSLRMFVLFIRSSHTPECSYSRPNGVVVPL